MKPNKSEQNDGDQKNAADNLSHCTGNILLVGGVIIRPVFTSLPNSSEPNACASLEYSWCPYFVRIRPVKLGESKIVGKKNVFVV